MSTDMNAELVERIVECGAPAAQAETIAWFRGFAPREVELRLYDDSGAVDEPVAPGAESAALERSLRR